MSIVRPVAAVALVLLLPAPARAATAGVVPVNGGGSYRNTVVYAGTCSYADGVLAVDATAVANSAVPGTVWARCFFMDEEHTRDLGGIEASGVAAAGSGVMVLPAEAARLCGTVIAYHPGLYAPTGPGRAGSSACTDLRSV